MIDINDFSYSLPDAQIARHPLPTRDQSRLLVYRDGHISHTVFSHLPELLPSPATLIFNNTRVIPARLHFTKPSGAVIEIFLLDPVWPTSIVAAAMTTAARAQWHCTIGNLKRWSEGLVLTITHHNLSLTATLVDRQKGIVGFEWSPADLVFSEVIAAMGSIPLPPYLKRKTEPADRERYQTVYSTEQGAVAAPTAGLHFTDAVFAALQRRGISSDMVTLHVSAGTFQPVKAADAKEHLMHAEQITISRQNIENLLQNKPVIAVGTTSLRTLESTFWYGMKLLHDPTTPFRIGQHDADRLTPTTKTEALTAVLKKMERDATPQLTGETAIYMVPGYRFQIVDALITNFHQPASTLILLVAAFVGPDWKKIYETALAEGYRFLSYGDSSLLFKKSVL